MDIRAKTKEKLEKLQHKADQTVEALIGRPAELLSEEEASRLRNKAGMTVFWCAMGFIFQSTTALLTARPFGVALLLAMGRNHTVAVFAAVLCEIPLTAVMLFNKEALAGLFPKIMEEISVFERFYVFINGTCDLTAFVYFLSVVAVFVYFTVQSLERRRWN